MIRISRVTARYLWWAMLWLMRRQWMKTLQRRSILLFPVSIRERSRRSLVRQNAFTRRYGLGVLTGVLIFFYASLAVTWCYQLAIYAVDSGALRPPSRFTQGDTDE